MTRRAALKASRRYGGKGPRGAPLERRPRVQHPRSPGPGRCGEGRGADERGAQRLGGEGHEAGADGGGEAPRGLGTAS